MDNTESKELLDIDDFEMDELLTEFAEDEKKNTVVELSDSEDELDKLVEEFATTFSDSEDSEKKSSAKIILSSSDDEIDNLLDDFNEEDSVESELVQVKQEHDTSDENKKSIIMIDNNIQNDTIYDSAVEIHNSNENTPVKSSVAPNLINSEKNESQSVSSLRPISINNYNQTQKHEKCNTNISRNINNIESTQNCFKENKSTYLHQSNMNFEKASQHKNHQRECSSSDDPLSISHKKDVYLPIKKLPASQNLETFVKSFIELNNCEKKPSPLAITNVTVLCDENILKSKNKNEISMTKLIEKTVDDCMSKKSKVSTVLSSATKTTENESTNCNGNFNIIMDSADENSSEMLPVINSVRGSDYHVQEKPERNISNYNSGELKSHKNIVEEETKAVSEDAEKIRSNTFSLTDLSIKSKGAVKSVDSDSSLNHLSNNSVGDIKVTNCLSSEKKVFNSSPDLVKYNNSLFSEKNSCSLSKSIMTENNIYNEQSDISKIAVEIKIHFSNDSYSEDNLSKTSNSLTESGSSVLPSSHKIENSNSKNSDVSIKLNGLPDKFVVPLANVIEEKILHSSLNNTSSYNQIISNTLKELKSKDLEGLLDGKSPLQEFKKRKLDTSDSEINAKKRKQEIYIEDNINKSEECDKTTLVFTEINEALPSNFLKKVQVSEKVLDYLVLQAYLKSVSVNFHEVSEAEKLIKELEEKSQNLSKTSNSLIASLRELRSAQKEAYESNSYKKISQRTVGINVKIINPKNKEIVKLPKKAASDESKTIRKENEVSVIKENTEASSLLKNAPSTKETCQSSSLLKNAIPVVGSKTTELPKASMIMTSNKEEPVSKQSKSEASNNLSSDSPKCFLQMEPKRMPFIPTKISPPNVIKSGNRLIPYLNPTKRIPYSNCTTNGNSLMKKLLESSEQLQAHSNENAQIGNNCGSGTLPQLQIPKVSESVVKPLNQVIQLQSSAKFDSTKVSLVLPFRTTASSITSTRTLNPVTYTVPQNSVVKNIPSVPDTLRNEIFRLPGPPQGIRTGSAVNNMFTKSTTGIIPNNDRQYQAGIPQFSQAYAPQGPMVSGNSCPFPLHHPATTASNYMQQSNLQMNSMHYFSNSACDPLTAMNHFSSSMGRPPLSLPHSVTSVNPSPSIMTSSVFCPRPSPLMNNFNPNQLYPNNPVNHFIPSPHDSIQFHQMAARSVPVSTTMYPPPSSSRLTSVIVPPPAMQSKFTSPSLLATSTQSVSFKQMSSLGTPPPPTISNQSVSFKQMSSLGTTPPPPTSNQSVSFKQISSLGTTTPATTSNQSISFKQMSSKTPPPSTRTDLKPKVPPLPAEPSYSEPLPRPKLKVTKEENDVILSWNVDLTAVSTTLSGYQIYSCHVSNEIEVIPIWKKVGDVKALRLPMACRLRQFEKNNSYHFIIRVVDNCERLGPFSNPASVNI